MSRCCHESRRSCRSWLPQVRAISFVWQIARSLDEWSRDLLIWQGWWALRTNCHVFKQACQSGQLPFHLSDIVFEFFLGVLHGTNSSFPLVSYISQPLEKNLALSISLDVWCMHAWYKHYGMICHAQECLINHALLPKYAQNFEDKETKKHNSNLNWFFIFFQISAFWSGHTIPIILYSNIHFS